MRTLVVNPGSSSLKLSVVDPAAGAGTGAGRGAGRGADTVGARTVRDWDGSPAPEEVRRLCADCGPVAAVGVRIVHGGERAGPVLLDDEELRRLEQYAELAPLHQTPALTMARTVREMFPDLPVLGCFDTSFHAGLPAHAATYPVPREWTDRYRLRRFGFHGLSCAYALRRAGSLLERDPGQLELICCHIGSGVSVTAIAHGRSVDTSMGLTPLDGTVMATRPGSLDPGLLLHVLRASGMPIAELESALSHRSGLAGLSGTSGDVRQVLAARERHSPDAELAVRVYLHRLRREIAAAWVSLGRLDAVVLTGGVAEHNPDLRAELFDGLSQLGLAVDQVRNQDTPVVEAGVAADRVISPDGATTAVVLIQAREDLEIGLQVKQALHR